MGGGGCMSQKALIQTDILTYFRFTTLNKDCSLRYQNVTIRLNAVIKAMLKLLK